MNRSLLIVVCDFLLLSILAIARFDQQEILESQRPQPVQQAAATPATDLVDTMRLTLEQERQAREALEASLQEEQQSREQAASALELTEQALASQQQLTAQREREIAAAREAMRRQEAEARRLEQERAQLASQFTETQGTLQQIQDQLASTEAQARASQERLERMQTEFAAAQTNLVTIQTELSSTSQEAIAARERLAQAQAELEARRREAQEARERITQIEDARRQAVVERERIAGELRVAETAQRMTREQLAAASNQIQVVQREKEQIQSVATELAEGVVQFAEKQGELAQEIREFRPLSPHAIFSEFITNRVSIDFRATRGGLLGRMITRDTQTKTVFVSSEDQVYAIFHVADTPLEFDPSGVEWERLVGQMMRMYATASLSRLEFLAVDPRVVVAPVDPADVRRLQVTPYKLASDPYRFQEALLIGSDEGYYGEGQFQIDPNQPNYIRMDRSRFGRLVGRFNPSRGDLVFAKSGELIGMMVNKEYCVLLTSFSPAGIISTGTNVRTSQTLSRMHSYINALPQPMR